MSLKLSERAIPVSEQQVKRSSVVEQNLAAETRGIAAKIKAAAIVVEARLDRGLDKLLSFISLDEETMLKSERLTELLLKAFERGRFERQELASLDADTLDMLKNYVLEPRYSAALKGPAFGNMALFRYMIKAMLLSNPLATKNLLRTSLYCPSKGVDDPNLTSRSVNQAEKNVFGRLLEDVKAEIIRRQK